MAAGVAVAGPSAADESWNYSDKGPDTWAENFPDDCAGSKQSPINLTNSDLRARGPEGEQLRVKYRRQIPVEVFNNTHTIQANVPSGVASIEVFGKTYELLQFHFHTPSEHEKNGETFPLEIHFVHADEDGNLAVIGVFFKVGPTNRVLAKMWQDLPDVDDSRTITVRGLQLKSLISTLPRATHYMGSLTTPPCSEGVAWFVLEETLRLSQDQLDAFTEIFSGEKFPEGNRRPVLELNDRDLVRVAPRFGD
jgi:carbonic anhydrase